MLNTTQKELLVFTKNIYGRKIDALQNQQKIDGDINIIKYKRIVKAAIKKYIQDYCIQGDEVFTDEDFMQVVMYLYNEVNNN